MNYAGFLKADIANGPGCRGTLFVSGCTHHCDGCFNSEAWNFSFGNEYTQKFEDIIFNYIDKPFITGLSILGGEPMELVNQEGIVNLVRRVHNIGKSIWIFSGYTWEELTDPSNERCHGPFTDEILTKIDVLVDGEFHIEEKDTTLKFRGSKNQRVIDVKESLAKGSVVLSQYM